MPELRPCKHCEHQVAFNAKRCPSCGGKDPYPMPEAKYGCLAIVAIAIVISIFTTQCGKGNGSSSSPDRQTSSTQEYSESNPHPANPFAVGRLRFDSDRADAGKDLFAEILGRYSQLDSFYRRVDRRGLERGFGAFISIPESAWGRLDEQDRTNLGHFMTRESPVNGWAIYVGSIDGGDVLSDRTGASSKDWDY